MPDSVREVSACSGRVRQRFSAGSLPEAPLPEEWLAGISVVLLPAAAGSEGGSNAGLSVDDPAFPVREQVQGRLCSPVLIGVTGMIAPAAGGKTAAFGDTAAAGASLPPVAVKILPAAEP